ncbi:hypothetical protein [Gulosibacter faecalis]|jgi:hypothetical protein|uniref:Uncharacterized protein n=1 Tax=Gulosibacter faecalis TaxID=272240 RepID=A0ABW5UTF7_9MICO|nr:hypothetical protein [Gulosibacter faecalis]
MFRKQTNPFLRIGLGLLVIGLILLGLNIFNTWQAVRDYPGVNFMDVFWITESSSGRGRANARLWVQVWGGVVLPIIGLVLVALGLTVGKNAGKKPEQAQGGYGQAQQGQAAGFVGEHASVQGGQAQGGQQWSQQAPAQTQGQEWSQAPQQSQQDWAQAQQPQEWTQPSAGQNGAGQQGAADTQFGQQFQYGDQGAQQAGGAEQTNGTTQPEVNFGDQPNSPRS